MTRETEFWITVALAVLAILLMAAAERAWGEEAGGDERPNLRPLLDAIRQVESSDLENPPRGDGGLARGPYQIHRVYWIDAVEHVPDLGGRYEDVDDREYAECIVLAYWHRHEPAALAAGDFETLARCHNGGPNWRRKPATKAYWTRVKEALTQRAQRDRENGGE